MKKSEEKDGQNSRAADESNNIFIRIKTGSDGDREQDSADNNISGLAQDDVKTENSEALPELILAEIRQGCTEPMTEGFGQDTEVHRRFCEEVLRKIRRIFPKRKVWLPQ